MYIGLIVVIVYMVKYSSEKHPRDYENQVYEEMHAESALAFLFFYL